MLLFFCAKKGGGYMTNGKLRQAKKAKNDEFYTEYSTISNEMAHHREQFRGQIVYCNCG